MILILHVKDLAIPLSVAYSVGDFICVEYFMMILILIFRFN